MPACLVYAPELADYDLGPEHPLKPERFTLAVALMEAYGLLAPPEESADDRLDVIAPAMATESELLLVHDRDYIDAVREASGNPNIFFGPRRGLGTMDTPTFPGMHEASALVAGATIRAADEVLGGARSRAFSVAGGLHHAHRDRAAGFCVYNDAAIGIAHALQRDPDLRILYVDIDAHHGDGVQEAFYSEPGVLTISVHETGLALYPGTGFVNERGEGAGAGFAANIPLPPYATDACYRLVFDEAIYPLARTFRPDLVFAQFGADAHHDDPLTTLGLTLAGHAWLVRSITEMADELCRGRIVAMGGGGYAWENVVPRAWTLAAATLAGVELDEALPESWRQRAQGVSHVEPPLGLTEDSLEIGWNAERALLAATRSAVDDLMALG
jgi:acetoin utilization protein AcuC